MIKMKRKKAKKNLMLDDNPDDTSSSMVTKNATGAQNIDTRVPG